MGHRFGMSLAEDKRGVLQDIQHPQEILTPADRNAHDHCLALIDSPPSWGLGPGALTALSSTVRPPVSQARKL